MWIALLAGGVLILLILQKQQQGTPAGSKTAGSDPNQPVNTSTFSGFDNIARDLTAARLGFGAMTFGSEADPAYLNLTSDAAPTLDGNPLDSIDVTSASPNSYRAPGVGLIAGFDLSHLIGALPTFPIAFWAFLFHTSIKSLEWLSSQAPIISSPPKSKAKQWEEKFPLRLPLNFWERCMGKQIQSQPEAKALLLT